MTAMKITSLGFVVIAGIFLAMLALLELGRRLGKRHLSQDPDSTKTGAIDGAVFGIMGLLIAFSFSGAASRFDTRRNLVVEEANNIGTAWLRLDLIPPDTQPALREKFRQYVDSRLAAYQKAPDMAAVKAELAKGQALQSEIWTLAVAACQKSSSPSTAMLLLTALNQMIDITTTRTMAAQMHPPRPIFVMLGLMVLAGALLAGYGMAAAKNRNWFHILAFAVVNILAVYIILDFEFPRIGFIRIDSFDQVLVDVRQSMKP